MGVVSSSWIDRVFILSSLHVQTLMSTDVQSPFLGTPLVTLKTFYVSASSQHRNRKFASLSTRPSIYISFFLSLSFSLSLSLSPCVCIYIYIYMYIMMFMYTSHL